MFQRYAREQTHTNTEIHKQTRSSEYDTLLPRAEQGITPGEARRYAPADGSSTVAKIAADLRPSADGSAVRTSLVAGGGYAAGSQRAYSLGSCAMGHTDGRIALFQNAHRAEVKVKFSHTRYRALGPELIPVYRQSARR